MKSRLLLFLAVITVGMAGLHGQIVFQPINGTGVEDDFRGALGESFAVNSTIAVDSVGYWDSGLNGITADGTITVAIFDNTSRTVVLGTEVVFTGTTGTLIGNTDTPQSGSIGQYRNSTLSAPVVLAAGNYSIVAQGFTSDNPYINGNLGTPGPVQTFNTLGGALTDNGAMSSLDNSFEFPTLASGSSPEVYGAADFTAVPEPATYAAILGSVSLLMAFWQRRPLQLKNCSRT